MPGLKMKISKPKPLTLQDLRKTGAEAYVSGDRLEGRRDNLLRAAKRVTKSPHRAILIPYLIRGILDYREKRPLTVLQKQLVLPLVKAGMAKQMLRQYRALPNATVNAFDQQYFMEKDQSVVDALLKEQLTAAALHVTKNLKEEPAPTYHLDGAFRDILFKTTSARTIQNIAEAALVSEPKCPPIYQLRLEYRGVTTHKISERAGGGGVDPYLVTAVYRIPYQILGVTGVMHELTAPMKVKHYPENLPKMSPAQISPSGGKWDVNGNPSDPIQFHPKVLHEVIYRGDPWHPEGIKLALPMQTPIEMAPLLRGKDLHLAVVSVWEEDGDQAAAIMGFMGKGMVSLGSEIMASLLPGAQVVGAAIVVIGVVLEVVSLLTGEKDDYIGDFVLVLDKDELDIQGYRVVSQRLKSDEGNDWTIYLGIESKALISSASG